LFTDIQGSTGLTQKLGDIGAMRVVRKHNDVVREALNTSGGREIKHTGNGIMASFSSVANAVECSITIQRRIADYIRERPEEALRVKAGLALESRSPKETTSSGRRSSSPRGCATTLQEMGSSSRRPCETCL
jgi:adenylate cyclase